MTAADNLREKATSGVLWSAFERFGQQGCVFVVQVILARLLAPEDFGLVAMVTVFVVFSSILANSGFPQALVQRKKVGEVELCSVFYFNLVVSCLLTVALYFLAPLVAAFYGQSELTPILRWLSLSLILGGLGATAASILGRRMAFKQLFWITLPTTLAAGAVAIAMALLGYGVWALVAQNLVQGLLMVPIFWWAAKWRPRLLFDFQCLREMFGFGSRLVLSGFLQQGFRNIYVLVVGKVFSATDLGFFQKARSFQRLPVENIQRVLGRVTFPLFSAIQDDPSRVRRGMARAMQFSTLVVLPGMALLSATAEPFTVALIGEKWLPSVPYLQWLCLSGALYPMSAININVLLSLGHSDLNLRLTMIKKTIEVGILLVSVRFGIMAMIYGMVLNSFISLAINVYYTRKLLGYSLKEQVADVRQAIGVAVVVFLSARVFVDVTEMPAAMEFLMAALLGACVFLLGIRFLDAGMRAEIIRILQRFPMGRKLAGLIPSLVQ